MEYQKIIQLLEKLGCRQIRRRTDLWIVCTCPLAPWTHAGGTDSHPSCAVADDIKNLSGVICKTCNYKGTLNNLILRLVYVHKQKHFLALQSFIHEHDITDHAGKATELKKMRIDYDVTPREVAGIPVSPRTYADLGGTEVEDLGVKEFPEEKVAEFLNLSEQAKTYLTDRRGLTEDSIKLWEVGWHPGAHRIVLPIRDVKHRLVGLTGARMRDTDRPKFLHARGFNRDLYLYGEHLVTPGGVGVLVEGFYDAICLRQRRVQNPVALMGTALSKLQAEKILRLFSKLVILQDGDKAGRESAEAIMRYMGPRLPTFEVPMPEGRDPDELTNFEIEHMLGPHGALIEA